MKTKDEIINLWHKHKNSISYSDYDTRYTIWLQNILTTLGYNHITTNVLMGGKAYNDYYISCTEWFETGELVSNNIHYRISMDEYNKLKENYDIQNRGY